MWVWNWETEFWSAHVCFPKWLYVKTGKIIVVFFWGSLIDIIIEISIRNSQEFDFCWRCCAALHIEPFARLCFGVRWHLICGGGTQVTSPENPFGRYLARSNWTPLALRAEGPLTEITPAKFVILCVCVLIKPLSGFLLHEPDVVGLLTRLAALYNLWQHPVSKAVGRISLPYFWNPSLDVEAAVGDRCLRPTVSFRDRDNNQQKTRQFISVNQLSQPLSEDASTWWWATAFNCFCTMHCEFKDSERINIWRTVCKPWTHVFRDVQNGSFAEIEWFYQLLHSCSSYPFFLFTVIRSYMFLHKKCVHSTVGIHNSLSSAFVIMICYQLIIAISCFDPLF